MNSTMTIETTESNTLPELFAFPTAGRRYGLRIFAGCDVDFNVMASLEDPPGSTHKLAPFILIVHPRAEDRAEMLRIAACYIMGRKLLGTFPLTRRAGKAVA